MSTNDLITAINTTPATHINYGQSDDYIRGFNRAYDDCDGATETDLQSVAPKDEPWRGAFLRGYRAGWRMWQEHQEDTTP